MFIGMRPSSCPAPRQECLLKLTDKTCLIDFDLHHRWDEMGQMDIPASVNYVLKVSQQDKLVFVCLSFGCTLFFIAASTHPSLNQQVDVVFALAPSTRVANMRQPVFDYYIVPFYEPIKVCL